MPKPRIVDLFCGAGGAARGLQRAGFYVVGFDIVKQPHYVGDEFHEADALIVDLSGFDAIWASPPCQDYSMNLKGLTTEGKYPRLIPDVRDRMPSVPWIIENVVGAPIPKQPTLEGDYGLMLCGTMFGLPNVQRHRLFLTSLPIPLPRGCAHRQPAMNPYDADARVRDGIQRGAMRHFGEAMGIDWMTGAEVSEAIPPAYSEYLGTQLLAELAVVV